VPTTVTKPSALNFNHIQPYLKANNCSDMQRSRSPEPVSPARALKIGQETLERTACLRSSRKQTPPTSTRKNKTGNSTISIHCSWYYKAAWVKIVEFEVLFAQRRLCQARHDRCGCTPPNVLI
jgi:hypothetical protein